MDGYELRRLRPGEEEDFLALMYSAFGFAEHFSRYLEFDDRLGVEDTFVIASAERIVSGVQIFTRPIRLRGESLLLGGIGSVATHPDHEGRGHATRLLHATLAEMQRREMALALLFTSRLSFYERLDWVQIPYRVWVLNEARTTEPIVQRPMRMSDLPCAMEIYSRYTKDLDGVTDRDEAYWRGQLRFAGNPDEDFRIVERAGEPVAYARSIPFEGLTRVMEFARFGDAAPELSRLLASMAPEGQGLFIPDSGDRELQEACRLAFRDVRQMEFPDQMWRVLDRERLRVLVGAAPGTPDADLLGQVVGAGHHLFWPSDRF